MNAKVFTIESGSVSDGAKVQMFRLSGGMEITAILIGESGRGREQGVLPVGNAPKMPCPNRHISWKNGPDYKSAFNGNEPGTKPERIPTCELCGEQYTPWELYSFNDGAVHGWKSVHPDRGEVLATLLYASVGESKSGRPKLVGARAADTDEVAIVVLRTKIGFRGGNSHTGDRSGEMTPCPNAGKIGRYWEQSDGTCPECGTRPEWVFYNEEPGLQEAAKAADYDMENGTFRHPATQIRKKEWAPFPGQVLVTGTIAQGDAGRAGSGTQMIAVVKKGEVFRTSYSGRLYGAPSAHYYMFDGEKIRVATWEERQTTDDMVFEM